MISITPLIYERKGTHTVELDEVVSNRLPPGAVRHFLLYCARLEGIALLPDHDHNDRNTRSHHHDSKGTVTPSPADLVVEKVRNSWPGESAGDCRGAVDTEHDHPVPQRGHIGQHDINDIQDTEMSDPVESVCSEISLYVLAGGFHDHANDKHDEHDHEPFNPTPDIDDLGKWEFRGTTEDGRDDANAR